MKVKPVSIPVSNVNLLTKRTVKFRNFIFLFRMIDVKVKWGGQMLLFTVSDESNIGDLKQEIYEKTKIKPERQKIIGIKAKDDDVVQEMVYYNMYNPLPLKRFF